MSILSEEKIKEVARGIQLPFREDSEFSDFTNDDVLTLCRAIESAVREELAKQEPVGVFDQYGDSYIQIKPEHADETSVKLYAAPVVQTNIEAIKKEAIEWACSRFEYYDGRTYADEVRREAGLIAAAEKPK